MADTVKYTDPGTGTTVSTEELTVKGVLQHVQRMKIAVGGSGVYKNDLDFGAAVTANSIPVNIASDQYVPVDNFTWSISTLARTYIYSALSTPAPTGVEHGVLTRLCGPSYNALGAKATYMASTNGTVTMSTTAGVATSLGYLWHPSSGTKRVSLQKMLLTFAGIGTGNFNILVSRITAEAGSPGGTSQNINAQDPSDINSLCTFRTAATGAPTRVSGDCVALTFKADADGYVDLANTLEGKGLICRASQGEGWEIRAIPGSLSLSASPHFALAFEWNEG